MSNKEKMAASIERYQQLNNNDLCPAHFRYFYKCCPEAEALFPDDNGLTHQQMQKEVINVILDAAAEKLDFIDGHLGSEMSKHEAYDVEPQMFEIMLKSLFDVIKKGLGEEWTDELDLLWNDALKDTLKIIEQYH
ncbi:MAG: globin [Pseudomonadales bacterium]|nr:globin [Pseudomonadales bacterium]